MVGIPQAQRQRHLVEKGEIQAPQPNFLLATVGKIFYTLIIEMVTVCSCGDPFAMPTRDMRV